MSDVTDQIKRSLHDLSILGTQYLQEVAKVETESARLEGVKQDLKQKEESLFARETQFTRFKKEAEDKISQAKVLFDQLESRDKEVTHKLEDADKIELKRVEMRTLLGKIEEARKKLEEDQERFEGEKKIHVERKLALDAQEKDVEKKLGQLRTLKLKYGGG